MNFLNIYFVWILYFNLFFVSSQNSVWHYECDQGYCVKQQVTNKTTSPLSLAECNLICLDAAGLWPKPTGDVTVLNLTRINLYSFSMITKEGTPVTSLVNKAFQIFTSQVRELMPCQQVLHAKKSSLNMLKVVFDITDQNCVRLKLDIDESYTLNISQTIGGIIVANIKAYTFFGARHALETLSQLVVYDDINNLTLLPNTVSIIDKPIYSWRGIVLDTSRNYITVKTIKRTLKAMAASKLNTFHWHISDTASFPYVSKSRPDLSRYGAYTPRKVYTDANIRNIIDYAIVRGIRVVPEFDAPAHVGEGWQNTDVVTCFNKHPWEEYCNEPPCGQFDPSKSELYDILEDIYGDMLEQFGNDIFHMGGDEVNIQCWNSTKSLTTWMVNEKGWGLTQEDFTANVWGYFQNEAVQRLYKKAGKEVPVILWTSDLTALDNVTSILPTDKYYIQVWTTADNGQIQKLLDKNYTLILSNFDALYLDCGLAAWVTDGNNWCSPYKGWQLVYENKPINIAGSQKTQFLGGEAALWTEQTGSNNVDSRLWPRAAAYAEALWTEPSSYWTDAEERMLLHRERLINLGIEADALEPEWCLQNQQHCPINGKFNIK